MFKVAIIGAENYGDYRSFAKKTIHLLQNKVKEGIMLLTVGDKFVEVFGKAANIDIKTFKCDWGAYGKNTLKKRNNDILNECDAIIIFQDYTKDTECIWRMAKEKGIPVRLISE